MVKSTKILNNKKGFSLIEALVGVSFVLVSFFSMRQVVSIVSSKISDIGEIETSTSINDMLIESILANSNMYQAHFKRYDDHNNTNPYYDTLQYGKLEQRFNDGGFCNASSCPKAKGRVGFIITPLGNIDVSKAIDKPNGFMQVFIRICQNQSTCEDFQTIF